MYIHTYVHHTDRNHNPQQLLRIDFAYIYVVLFFPANANRQGFGGPPVSVFPSPRYTARDKQAKQTQSLMYSRHMHRPVWSSYIHKNPHLGSPLSIPAIPYVSSPFAPSKLLLSRAGNWRETGAKGGWVPSNYLSHVG